MSELPSERATPSFPFADASGVGLCRLAAQCVHLLVHLHGYASGTLGNVSWPPSFDSSPDVGDRVSDTTVSRTVGLNLRINLIVLNMHFCVAYLQSDTTLNAKKNTVVETIEDKNGIMLFGCHLMYHKWVIVEMFASKRLLVKRNSSFTAVVLNPPPLIKVAVNVPPSKRK
ncbi:hypothetical protein T4C_9022 [Trichinella pseudospiralis]|uniref:Uncharacterized protein n=1 Tax=Trichinella pseudospiralis TaxID=6337 RepID=A0A0V1K5V2_TRIPS|nr:hypothetical protein T4C_9022 [Trichinella pseudospiralis]